MKKIVAFTTACFLFVMGTYGNNLQITDVSQSGPNITFKVSWDNSWNTINNINPLYPNNWDGVWLFVKYQNQIDNLWKHAKVSNSASDHTVTGGSTPLSVEAFSDSMGIIIRRTNAGAGNISTAIVTLKMGSLVGEGDFNFKVFGIEMVYANQDTVQVGDGQVSSTQFFTPITINAARQSTGLAAGQLYSGSPAIPSTFPMGYNAFYSMKYELTNEQWVDFLNTLNYDQQATRIDVAPNAAVGTRAFTVAPSVITGNTIEIMVPGENNTKPAVFGCDFTQDNVYNTENDGQNIPFNMCTKADAYAYLDWSGLRPMTELEYEKLCRGPLPRVSGEYAWGSNALAVRTRVSVLNGGRANETINVAVVNGQAIANSANGTHGPVRPGIFATSSSGRQSSGAGFYGNMELSGNLWEIVVTAGTGGTQFTGNIHGDGMLDINGNPNIATWPNPNGAANTGTLIRGGSWWEAGVHVSYLLTSYRFPSGLIANARSYIYGIRGVRTAE